ncbi:MAG TPA: hypothetical protein VF273_06470 [Pelobium sp.]
MRNIHKVFFVITFALSAGCGNRNNAGEVENTQNLSLDSSAFQNIILRDSITLMKYKNRVDTISFPVINPQFKALAKSVTPEEILGERIFGIKENYENCGCGYTFLNYRKTFSNSNIISLVFQTSFVGPYPSETTIYKTLKIRDGKLYTLKEQLAEAGQVFVLKGYKDELLKRLEADKSNHEEADYQVAYLQIKQNIGGLTFRAIDDNYIVSGDSIIVKTEPILPHATLAWEINRKLSFSLAELKRFRKNSASI